MERLDVPVNETWNLTLIYKNKDEFFDYFLKKEKKMKQKFLKYQNLCL